MSAFPTLARSSAPTCTTSPPPPHPLRAQKATPDESDPLRSGTSGGEVWREVCSGMMSCFCAVFLAEFGDRTQIVMVSLHASNPVAPIVAGSLLAFLVLSASAALLSAFLATRRLDAKVVRVLVALSFALFAAIALHDGLQSRRGEERIIFTPS